MSEMESETERAEREVEEEFRDRIEELVVNGQLKLEILVSKHISYLQRSLNGLKSSFTGLDASQTWLMYWTFNALAILDSPIEITPPSPTATYSCIVMPAEDVLQRQHSFKYPQGGFGGGPNQLAHLAPTYSAIQACLLAKTYDVIDRQSLRNYIQSMKLPDGSFRMHDGGESDLRASYCAMVSAFLCNLFDDHQKCDSLRENVAEYIASCQTYEGGFSSVPGMEAHAGYTYCGFAALLIVGGEHLVDLDALERWAVFKITNQGGTFTFLMYHLCY